jgi:hypothetical protein
MVTGIQVKRLCPEMTVPRVWGVGRLKAILVRSNETKNGGIYLKRPKCLSIKNILFTKSCQLQNGILLKDIDGYWF